ncbi:uncharacterized protein LOC109926765 [Rhincodon typus]|uniref:uncharacterized protein LOC109926765 n=1 Tax=Rhincodon typus TaxID=259920 RepID=UPI002030F292|nr:uncharacterized protein LOC109926765 [Rhincodon typus]
MSPRWARSSPSWALLSLRWGSLSLSMLLEVKTRGCSLTDAQSVFYTPGGSSHQNILGSNLDKRVQHRAELRQQEGRVRGGGRDLPPTVGVWAARAPVFRFRKALSARGRFSHEVAELCVSSSRRAPLVLLNGIGQMMSMMWPVTLLWVGLDILLYQEVASLMNDEETMCIIEKISDDSICRGELLVIYPDLGNAACAVIPRCRQFRRLLSEEWGEPRVKFVQAKKDMNYVLIMVDPDAPSKENPKYRFWRHWLVTNINKNV